MIQLPDSFTQTIIGVHGENGARWLADFDALVQYCERNWSFRVLAPYELSYNYVAPVVYADGTEAVLKLAVPGKELLTELEALRHYQGYGMACLLDADRDKGVLILERLKPGKTLHSLGHERDEEATAIAAGIMKKLHVPIKASHPELFPSVKDWSEGLKRLRQHYNGGTGTLSERMVEQAEHHFVELLNNAGQPLLLHGDLHHGNIIAAERESWLAIDPKGVIGEAEYGVIPFLLNHVPSNSRYETTERRIDILTSLLQLDKRKVLAYGLSHSVLSAWWCLESGCEGADGAMGMAALFGDMLSLVK